MCRDSADTEYPGVTARYRGVERDDGFWLEAEQTHVSYIAVTVTHPHVTVLLGIHSVNGRRAGKLQT